MALSKHEVIVALFVKYGEDTTLKNAMSALAKAGHKDNKASQTAFYRIRRDYNLTEAAIEKLGADAENAAIFSFGKSKNSYFRLRKVFCDKISKQMESKNGVPVLPESTSKSESVLSESVVPNGTQDVSLLLDLDKMIKSIGKESIDAAVKLVNVCGGTASAAEMISFIENVGGVNALNVLLHAWNKVRE